MSSLAINAMPEVVRRLEDVEQIERTPWRDAIRATNTYDVLRTACERWPERVALRLLLDGSASAPTRDVRYAELLEGIHRTANTLHRLGVTPGVPVAILLPNLIEGHLALWGAEATGIASPINPMLESSFIARICEETGARVVIALGPTTDGNIWEKAVEVADRLPRVHTILQVDPMAALGGRICSGGHTPRGKMPARTGVQVLDFHDALAESDSTRLISGRRFTPTEPCAYFHTGGTTGYPKVAVHSHLNEAVMAWVLQRIDDRRNVMLAGLPLFHVNGAMVTGLGALHSGSEIVMLTAGGYRTPGLLDAFWEIANRFGTTTFSAVPTILAALLSRPLPADGVPTLRHVLCGAAPLPSQVAHEFEKLTGVRIHEGYGLTEGSCVSTVNPPQAAPKAGTVGIRIPYQELKLFKLCADGRPAELAEAGTTGVIGIRGPNVFPGYLREGDNRGIWIEGGWFNTGDLGRLDADGALTLCGRAKDLIIRGGHNIDPSMIEDAIAAHPAVAMVAAVGQPDIHAGELPVAFAILKPGGQACSEALMEYARERIPERAAVPVRIEIMPTLPLTAVGKVSKPDLRLLTIEHVIQAALAEDGMSDTRVKARLCPERGAIADISGPVASREAAVALVARYPVIPAWQEQ
ncbi:acyl-CoA synthetase [Cupriavidus sp. 2MCAB6]|uniref:acyl-CoA synthetase n=1 Tax=Cupriavidus sp. 2MCAB6 TaxID=3232981 RepID=UPI003F8DB3F9